MPLIHTRRLLVRSDFLLVFAGQRFLGIGAGLVTITMMRLFVEDVHAVERHQLAAGTFEHLGVSLDRLDRLGRVSG